MGMRVIVKDRRVFQDTKMSVMELRKGKILEENWFSLLSTRHWEMN